MNTLKQKIEEQLEIMNKQIEYYNKAPLRMHPERIQKAKDDFFSNNDALCKEGLKSMSEVLFDYYSCYVSWIGYNVKENKLIDFFKNTEHLYDFTEDIIENMRIYNDALIKEKIRQEILQKADVVRRQLICWENDYNFVPKLEQAMEEFSSQDSSLHEKAVQEIKEFTPNLYEYRVWEHREMSSEDEFIDEFSGFDDFARFCYALLDIIQVYENTMTKEEVKEKIYKQLDLVYEKLKLTKDDFYTPRIQKKVKEFFSDDPTFHKQAQEQIWLLADRYFVTSDLKAKDSNELDKLRSLIMKDTNFYNNIRAYGLR